MAIPSYVLDNRLLLEEASRAQSQTVGLGDRTILCRVLGKYLMFADTDDFSVTPHVTLNGYWESWTTVAVARALQPGTHAIDVGANHGYFTLLMADAAGDEGRVLAIEPNPRLAELVTRTVDVNGYSRCCRTLPYAAAASSRGTARLAVPRHRLADASIVGTTHDGDDVIEVQTIAIDDAAADWERVDFIKIDAEGAEETIWDGMRRTLRRNADIVVVMEFKPASYSNARAFLDRIRDDGFRLRCIGFDGAIEDLHDSDGLSADGRGEWMLFLQR